MGRLDLHAKLVAITPKAYYQPPSNLTLSYPCIVYSRKTKLDTYADDKKYFGRQGYQITVIDNNPDSTVSDEVETLPYCRWENEFTNENLYHTVFTVYN